MRNNLILISLLVVYIIGISLVGAADLCGPISDIGTMNQTPNQTPGLMNQTENMTANMTMNMTANSTIGPQGVPGTNGAPGPDNDAWYLWVNGSRTMTGNLSMNGLGINNIWNISDPSDAINVSFAWAMNNSMRNNVSQYVISVNNSMLANVSSYVISVNDSMRNNVSQYMIAANQSLFTNLTSYITAVNDSMRNNASANFPSTSFVNAVNDSMRNNVSQFVISANQSLFTNLSTTIATANQSLFTNLSATFTTTVYVDAVNASMRNNVSQYVIAVNNSMRNNVSQFVISANQSLFTNITNTIVSANQSLFTNLSGTFTTTAYVDAVNNSMRTNVSQYVISVNDSMRNNVSQFVISANQSLFTNLTAFDVAQNQSVFTNLTGTIVSANQSLFTNLTATIVSANSSLFTNLTSYINNVNTSMRNNISANFAPMVGGKVPTVNLGGAGADATKYLRGDQSWQVPAGGSDPTASSTTLIHSDFYDPGVTTALPGLTGLAISSGTAAVVATTANHPGVIYMRDSTTANGGYKYGCVGTQLVGGGETFEVVFQPVGVRVSQYADMGWSDTAAAATLPVDGVWFNITGTGAAITLRGNTSSNSVRSGTLTTYAPTTATWYRGTIAINSAGTLVTYTLYSAAGASLWTDTVATNIPTGAGRDTSPCLIVAEGSTDAAADILGLDFVRWGSTRTLVR